MSTKIYWAWRVPADRLNDFIDMARDQLLLAVRDRIRVLMTTANASKIGEAPEWAKTDAARERWEQGRRYEVVESLCVAAAKGGERDPICDVECGFNVWLHDGHAYFIPIAEHWLKDLIKVPWAEDFRYWNNTDLPDGVSEETWDARGRTWDAVNCGEGRAEHNARRLFHEVVGLRKGVPWSLREAVLAPEAQPQGEET